MKKIKLLFINGIAVSLTAIASGICGIWINLLITKSAGAAVMGKYQLITSVCGFGITFAVSGINFAAMRLCAEGIASKGNIHGIMKKCFSYAAFFGISSGVILFFAAEVISDNFIKYREAAFCLKIFSLSLPFVSCLSAVSGYLTAARRSYKESLIKIAVQILKLALTAVFLFNFKKNPCVSIMTASVLAELSGTALSLSLYISDRKKAPDIYCKNSSKLLPIALPIAFSSYLRCGLMTVKNLLVPISLTAFGLTEKSATAAFGSIHGIALPTVLFPSTLLFSFSALTVPELAGAHVQSGNISENRSIRYIIDRSVQLTVIFSAFCAGFMFFFSKELGSLMSDDVNTAIYIKVLALIVPVMYLDNTVDSILKGLNEQVASMKINIIDSCVCLAMVIFLLPKFGVAGYLFTICAGEILNFSLSLMHLIKISYINIKPYRNLFVPHFSIIISCMILKLFNWNFCIFIKLLLCAAMYPFFVSVLDGFTKEDRAWLKNIFSSKNKNTD